jgi:hypothetical protein
MIKFFRKIRQQLLTDKKFSKYLLYALGEIFLVVIGILIALFLNNLNESSKNNQLENAYLKGVLKNIDVDMNELKVNLKKDSLKFINYTILQKAFNDEVIKSDKRLMANAVLNSFGYYGFNSNRIVFDDLISSGKINLIKSDSIRLSIMDYYQKTENFQNAHKSNTLEFMIHQRAAINGKIGIHTILETRLYKKEFIGVVNDLDFSFFNKDTNEEEVKEFAYNLGLMKINIWGMNQWHKRLLGSAEALKMEISNYLEINAKPN